jgi:hypothetical protein
LPYNEVAGLSAAEICRDALLTCARPSVYSWFVSRVADQVDGGRHGGTVTSGVNRESTRHAPRLTRARSPVGAVRLPLSRSGMRRTRSGVIQLQAQSPPAHTIDGAKGRRHQSGCERHGTDAPGAGADRFSNGAGDRGWPECWCRECRRNSGAGQPGFRGLSGDSHKLRDPATPSLSHCESNPQYGDYRKPANLHVNPSRSPLSRTVARSSTRTRAPALLRPLRCAVSCGVVLSPRAGCGRAAWWASAVR